MPTVAGSHCRYRLFEWISTLIMLGLSVTLFISPRSIEHSTFHMMLEIGISQRGISFLFFIFGIMRIAALYANGRWAFYGPMLRSLCALGASALWFQMMLALIAGSLQLEYITPGVPVYFFLAVGEIASCYRAAVDGNRYKFR